MDQVKKSFSKCKLGINHFDHRLIGRQLKKKDIDLKCVVD